MRTRALIGVRPAMDLMLTGKPCAASKALAVGLVDRLVPPAELARPRASCIAAAARRRRRPPLRRPAPGPGAACGRSGARRCADSSRQSAAPEHYPAPYAIIDLWVRYGAPGHGAYEAEARSIAAPGAGDTARNLVRVFLLQDRLKGLGGKSAADIRHVHVVGAGVMGGDIAAWCALRGLDVTLQDRERRIHRAGAARARGRCSTSA